MITLHSFISTVAGPHLLVLGGVHGNEICGIEAISRIVPEFESGELELKRGRVTFVPVCNPRAYAQGVRYTERNLNRLLMPMDKPDCYEAELGNILCPIIKGCDFLLDIHSYTAGGPPFVFAKNNEKSKALASALGSQAIISGWAEAFGEEEGMPPNWGIGTSEYADMFGIPAVTLECGQHKAPDVTDIAYTGIRRILAHLQMAEGAPAPAQKPMQVIMKQVFRATDAGRFSRSWKHLDVIPPDTLVATRGNGEQIRSPAYTSVIVMPKADATEGQEWFYLGEKVG